MNNIQKQKQELEFYKNGSAESVLKRFVFSEEEEKLVRDAIRTAHLANPRMKLIRDADELLREIAKTREVISTNDTQLSKESLAKLKASSIAKVNSVRNPIMLAYLKKIPLIIVIGILLTLVYVNMTRVEDRTLKPVTFTEAQEICKEKQMVLPITYEDLGNKLFQPTNKNEIGYWTNEQTIATLPGQWFMEDDGKKHYVYCVKKNGKESSFQVR